MSQAGCVERVRYRQSDTSTDREQENLHGLFASHPSKVIGSRATIHLPNGDKEVVDDPRIDAPSNVATFEAFADNADTDSHPAFAAIWAN
jgi:hypothetical protein